VGRRHHAAATVVEEHGKAIGMIGNEGLACEIGPKRIGRQDALTALTLATVECHDVGAVFLDREQGFSEIEAGPLGQFLAPPHHQRGVR